MSSNESKYFVNKMTMRLLGPQLQKDLTSSLVAAVKADAVFPFRATPLGIFRGAISEAIGAHAERIKILLKDCDAPDSKTVRATCTEDYYWAVRFAVSRAVAAIQGSLAEMLALGPLTQLVDELKQNQRIPKTTRMWVGDSIMVSRLIGTGLAKGADIHLLSMPATRKSTIVIGVAEVKSYRCTQKKIAKQLSKHLYRASSTLMTQSCSGKRSKYFVCLAENPLKISVVPSSWRLSRHLTFHTNGGSRFLIVIPPKSASPAVAIQNTPNHWKIVLHWSHEALADAAFEIFRWYLGCLGEELYSQQHSPWPEMSPAEAGRNSVAMAFYYAILHISEPNTLAQAIKLYNVLGYGFALGSNFRGSDGRPAMLWPEDLDEILLHGQTRYGSYIDGMKLKKPDALDGM